MQLLIWVSLRMEDSSFVLASDSSGEIALCNHGILGHMYISPKQTHVLNQLS